MYAGFAFHADTATFYKIIIDEFSERSVCELSEIQVSAASFVCSRANFRKQYCIQLKRALYFVDAFSLYLFASSLALSRATHDGHCPKKITSEKNDNIWVNRYKISIIIKYSKLLFFPRMLCTSSAIFSLSHTGKNNEPK